MAEETLQHHQQSDEAAVETKDRGLFDFLGKKDEEHKPQEEVISSDFDTKVHVSELEHKYGEHHKVEEEEKKPSLLEKLHRSSSSSSSSSEEEEVNEHGAKIKKKKKQGLKEKIKEKISGGTDGEKAEDTSVPVEKVEEPIAVHGEGVDHEKKGFLDKIKEKLPGGNKQPEELPPPPPPAAAEYTSHEGEPKEKKGILEKIKEKLPGYHPKTEEEKESASH